MPQRPTKARPSRPKRRPASKPPAEPLLRPSDVRTIVSDLCTQLAPADVAALMNEEKTLRARAAELPTPHLSLLRDQLGLALDCLRDHLDGRCPQIPYYTISLIGAALLYFTDEFDAIPDFLPEIGHLDDAVVMAMAFELGADGLRRYCDFKDIDATGLLPPRRS